MSGKGFEYFETGFDEGGFLEALCNIKFVVQEDLCLVVSEGDDGTVCFVTWDDDC